MNHLVQYNFDPKYKNISYIDFINIIEKRKKDMLADDGMDKHDFYDKYYEFKDKNFIEFFHKYYNTNIISTLPNILHILSHQQLKSLCIMHLYKIIGEVCDPYNPPNWNLCNPLIFTGSSRDPMAYRKVCGYDLSLLTTTHNDLLKLTQYILRDTSCNTIEKLVKPFETWMNLFSNTSCAYVTQENNDTYNSLMLSSAQVFDLWRILENPI